jgi:hypothetical protein
VELCDALRFSSDPDLREALLANTLNQVHCGCGHTFRVDKNLLVHDDRHGVMIYLAPAPADRAAEVERSFVETLRQMTRALPDGMAPPRVMLTLSRVELIERIFLVEAGLDERLIEYVKHTIYTRNLRQVPFEHKLLLFNAQDSTPDHLHFVVMDAASHRLESVVQFPRPAYQALAETFNQDHETGRLLELFPGPYISARRVLREAATAGEVGSESHD